MAKEKPLERILNTYVPIEGFTPAISLEKEPIDKRLQHYGVPGMKWGVRKEYEPHPLQKSSISNKSNKNRSSSGSLDNQIVRGLFDRNGIVQTSKRKKEWERTYQANIVLNKQDEKGTIENDANLVNTMDAPGKENNCTNCTMAYELRRRGYDVVANPTLNSVGRFRDDHAKMFNTEYIDAKFDHIDDEKVQEKFLKNNKELEGREYNAEKAAGVAAYKSLMSELGAYENGARGSLGVTFQFGGGHVLNWEKQNGKVHLIDSQDRTANPKEWFEKADIYASNVSYFRTDNATIDVNSVGEYVSNRKKGGN